jgi:hypothetical protein
LVLLYSVQAPPAEVGVCIAIDIDGALFGGGGAPSNFHSNGPTGTPPLTTATSVR